MPMKKYWEDDWKYTAKDRTFKGTCRFEPVTVNNGEVIWEFTMVFSANFLFIESGKFISKDSNQKTTDFNYFGIGKEYDYKRQ